MVDKGRSDAKLEAQLAARFPELDWLAQSFPLRDHLFGRFRVAAGKRKTKPIIMESQAMAAAKAALEFCGVQNVVIYVVWEMVGGLDAVPGTCTGAAFADGVGRREFSALEGDGLTMIFSEYLA